MGKTNKAMKMLYNMVLGALYSYSITSRNVGFIVMSVIIITLHLAIELEVWKKW